MTDHSDAFFFFVAHVTNIGAEKCRTVLSAIEPG